ncbi:serine/arginine repetitive matrix protein 2 [Streptomyces sp. NBC_01218]|uniref:serine/arginine repetitive matrix protein 2 n=1 Tax=Streptomyces sp. NBC_01218 TaxID=2903780 RepID=UPI002E14F4EE|nr:serine/arginine repetitive matrix protein 2 [Streptomyces sp. NBC_01218]
MTGGGAPRWNDEAQRWETGDHTPRAAPPPLPDSPPVAPSPAVRMRYPSPPPGPPQPPGPPRAEDGPPHSGYVDGPDGRGGFTDGLPGGFVGGFVGEVESGDGGGATEEGVGTRWQRFTPLTAGLAVGVLAACTAALWFTLAQDPDPNPAARGTSASGSALTAETSGGEGTGGESPAEPTGEGPAPTDEETPASAAPGYTAVDDPSGFTVVVPEEWQDRTDDDHGVYYTSADGTALLQIWRVTGVTTALDAVHAASDSRSASPGFQEISVEPVDTPDGSDAAELVYAYDHEATGTRRKVVDRVFTASDGGLYALLVAAPDTQWPLHEEILDEAVAGFDPYGAGL